MRPKKCAIVSTPRSGTHFLRFTLNNHPCLEFSGEFFREPIVSSEYEYECLIPNYIYDNICDPSMSHLDYVGFVWHLSLESDIQKNEIDKFILLERKNKLEQFVSLKIASATGRFAYTTTTEKIKVEPKEFFFFVNKNRNLYSDFRNSTQNYKDIYYEELCGNFEDTIEDINDYLGVRQETLLTEGILKQETRPMKEVIINYEDVKQYDRFW